MNIHLHFAQMQTMYAAEQIGSASWSERMLRGESMRDSYLKQARAYLAQAVTELDAYEATLAEKVAAE